MVPARAVGCGGNESASVHLKQRRPLPYRHARNDHRRAGRHHHAMPSVSHRRLADQREPHLNDLRDRLGMVNVEIAVRGFIGAFADPDKYTSTGGWLASHNLR